MLDLRSTEGVGFLALLGFAVMAAGCGGRGPAAAPRASSLDVRSADVEQRALTLSCHGAAFCREDVVTTSSADAVEELTDLCSGRGGTTRRGPCAREHVLASCAVTSGEYGSILVLTYAQASPMSEAAAVSTMSNLCEHFDGSFAIGGR